MVKLFLREPGSDEAARLTRGAGARLFASALARAEARFAFRARVHQRAIPELAAVELAGRLDRDLHESLILQPVSDAVIDLAGAILDRQALRAYDAVQLASCVIVAGPGGRDVMLRL